MGSQSKGHGLVLLTCALNVGVSSKASGVWAPVEDHKFFLGGESLAQESLEQGAGTDSSVWQATKGFPARPWPSGCWGPHQPHTSPSRPLHAQGD